MKDECAYCDERIERGWACEACPRRDDDPDVAALPDWPANGPLTREGLRVRRRRCATCIFHPGNRMELRAGRVAGMVREALENDSFIPCHKTLEGEQAVCRGFWEGYRTDTLACRLGAVIGVIEV